MKLSIVYSNWFRELPEGKLQAVKDSVKGLDISIFQQKTVTKEDLIESEVIYGAPPPEMLKELKNLKWLHLPSTGAREYADAALYASPTPILTNSSGAFGISMSEHVVGMMISLTRNFGKAFQNMKLGKWDRNKPEFPEIFGSKVVLLGLGKVGTEICKRLSCFNCKIIGFRRNLSRPHEWADEIHPISELHTFLPDADYIISCLPATAETEKLIGKQELALMKKRAILINVSRGSVVDTGALTEALRDHMIAGAGLDVTDPEPLPAEHPLWQMENVLITPHLSGSSEHKEERRLSILLDLLERYMSGQELYNLVNFSSNY